MRQPFTNLEQKYCLSTLEPSDGDKRVEMQHAVALYASRQSGRLPRCYVFSIGGRWC